MLALSLLLALFGADFTPDEQKLLDGLPDPERAYVLFALSHGENVTLGVAKRETMEVGMSGSLRKIYSRIKVIDRENVLMTHTTKRQIDGVDVHVPTDTYWVSGFNTLNVTDDDEFLNPPVGAVFVVVGTRQTNEDKIVKHLALVDQRLANPVLDQLLQNRGMRTWDIAGGSVRARLKSSGDPVVLVTPEGTERRVRKARLTDDEKRWIIDEMRRRRTSSSERRGSK